MRGAVTNFVLLGVNIGHLGEVNGLLIMQESTDLLKKKKNQSWIQRSVSCKKDISNVHFENCNFNFRLFLKV